MPLQQQQQHSHSFYPDRAGEELQLELIFHLAAWLSIRYSHSVFSLPALTLSYILSYHLLLSHLVSSVLLPCPNIFFSVLLPTPLICFLASSVFIYTGPSVFAPFQFIPYLPYNFYLSLSSVCTSSFPPSSCFLSFLLASSLHFSLILSPLPPVSSQLGTRLIKRTDNKPCQTYTQIHANSLSHCRTDQMHQPGASDQCGWHRESIFTLAKHTNHTFPLREAGREQNHVRSFI